MPDRTPYLVGHAENPDRFQHPQHADRIRVGRIFRALEADADMALRGEIVDFGRLNLLHEAYQIG
jgi:hypothetical protein